LICPRISFGLVLSLHQHVSGVLDRVYGVLDRVHGVLDRVHGVLDRVHGVLNIVGLVFIHWYHIIIHSC